MPQNKFRYIVLYDGHPQEWHKQYKGLFDSYAGGNTQGSHRSTNPATVFPSYGVARRCIDRTENFDSCRPLVSHRKRDKYVIVRLSDDYRR